MFSGFIPGRCVTSVLAILITGMLCQGTAAQECNPDLLPPTMVMLGSETQDTPFDQPYVDPGVIAFDNCDGDISDRVIRTGTVDTKTPGVYVLRYDVMDTAGNITPPIFRQPVVLDKLFNDTEGEGEGGDPCEPRIDCPPDPIAPGGAFTITVLEPCLIGNMVFQLYFGGALIAQSVDGTFSFDGVDCDDAGWYTVVISNAVTSVSIRCFIEIGPCGEGEGGEGEGEGEGESATPLCDLFPTCFSGLVSPLPPTTPYPADTSGFVFARIDARNPPIPPTPAPILDVNWQPPMDHNEFPVGPETWNAGNLGQVFGIALDDEVPPNIYLTATTVYGLFAPGPGGHGAVYRVDGVTNDICVLATLPNSGPALGNICYVSGQSQLFVSNHEDGLIYRIPIDGSCTPSGPITTYDHGVNGRPNDGFSVIADAGTLNTFTDLGRRVWAVEDYNGRLFYSTWWENTGRPSIPNDNEIWSVALDGSGVPIPTTAQREFEMPPRSGVDSNPVSDINFGSDGSLFTSERTMTTYTSYPDFGPQSGDHGLLHLGARPAHAARLMKFTGPVGGPWITNDEFRVGSYSIGQNSAGGATIDCEDRPWSTGDAIHYSSSTGHTDLIYGLQRIDAAGNQFDVPFSLNSIVIGLGGGGAGYAKTEIGDVESWKPDCPTDGGGEEGEGQFEGEGEQEGEGEAPCEKPSTIYCSAGIADEFDPTNGPEVATPSTALMASVLCQGGPLTLFDTVPDSQCFVHTFSNCCFDDCEVLSATLSIIIRAASGAGNTTDDTISLGTGGGALWNLPIANISSTITATWQSGTWNPGESKTIYLDLGSLPVDSNPANNVSILSTICNLDVLIEDSTVVDSMRLIIERCCDDPGGEGEDPVEGEGEGEGEGAPVTEGEAEGEGEGERPGEGEGDPVGEGEGEDTGEGDPGEGEREGEDDTGPCNIWTDEADFEEGFSFNLDPVDMDGDFCLELSNETRAWPYIGIANSGRNTVIRADVNTGDVVGEYFTRPDGMAGNPSRTTVDAYGNVWVGNRNESAGGLGSVTRFGLAVGGIRTDASGTPDPSGEYLQSPDYCTCEDRDSDGLIRTSVGFPWATGPGDYAPTALPWTNAGSADTNGGVSTAEDECITAYVRVAGTAVRFVAIDPFGDVWTGGRGNRLFEKIDGLTATTIPSSQFNSMCGGYGGLVDPNNVIWSAYWDPGDGSGFMRYDSSFTSSPLTCITGIRNYGVGIDPDTCNIWTTAASADNNVREVSPSGTLLNVYNHFGSGSNRLGRGIVVSDGNVWVAHSNSSTVGRVSTAGVHLGNVNVGSRPTGVAVDTNGKVWSTNQGSNTASRIDPTTVPGLVDLTVDLGSGASPYNYSDMTGSVLLQAVAPQGSWTTVYDSGALGCEWGELNWLAYQDPGTTVTVRVRASDSPSPSGPWTNVSSGVPFTGVTGRYLQVQVILTRPAKSDAQVKICELEVCKPGGCMKLNILQKDCDPDTGDITTEFEVTNMSESDATTILITPQTPNVNITPNVINQLIPIGDTATFSTTVSGAIPGQLTCFTVTLLNQQNEVCCSQTICVRFDCPGCIEFVDPVVECDPENPGQILYSFSVKNRTADTIEHAYFYPPAGTTFTPGYVPIVPPLGPSDTSGLTTLSITTDVPPGEELCFDFSAHDRELNRCCYETICIVVPDCGQGEGEDVGEGAREGDGGEEGEPSGDGEGHGGPEGDSEPCLQPGECDDGDPCTIDDCDPATGLCVYTPIVGCGEGEGGGGEEGQIEGHGEAEGEDCAEPVVESCTSGAIDQFDLGNGNEATSPSAALLAAVDCPAGPLTSFDMDSLRQCFVHTFTECCLNDCEIIDATLTISMRARSTGVSPVVTNNDLIRVGSNGFTFWSLGLANLSASGTWFAGTWNPGESRIVTLDLMDLPNDSNPANNTDITSLFKLCELDVLIKDYTAVDYMTLDITKCCDGGTEGSIEGEPGIEGELPCDVIIDCPNQPLTRGEPGQLCVIGDLDCLGQGLVFRWFRDGVLVAVTSTPCLNFPAVTCADMGVYTVQITGSNGVTTTAECKVKVKPCKHVIDLDADDLVSLSELLRGIQLYNSNEYHCDAAGEDGYAPGPGPRTCLPHPSDYNPEDWQISLNEVLRIIQFFNSGGIYACPDIDPPSEDGFCAGPPPDTEGEGEFVF